MPAVTKTRRRTRAPATINPGELVALRAQLAESVATLHAIRDGQVDAVVVTGTRGRQVFTLEGADHAYRVLIESMNEGALTLTSNAEILYANGRFARMVKRPMEQVIGGCFYRFLSPPAKIALRGLLQATPVSGTTLAVELLATDRSCLPVQLSVQTLGSRRSRPRLLGVVVTDMTEARRSEELVRALSQRRMDLQEAERGRLGLELHDHITQQLCATLIQTEVLAKTFLGHNRPGKRAAAKLGKMLGHLAGEVERISRSLRPSVLDQLGLIAALRETASNFARRTGLALSLALPSGVITVSAIMELALYRILQEALLNIERHARAHQISIQLKLDDAVLVLTIRDDGIGVDRRSLREIHGPQSGLGLNAMRERAVSLGGHLRIRSRSGCGTTLFIRLPYFSKGTLLP